MAGATNTRNDNRPGGSAFSQMGAICCTSAQTLCAALARWRLKPVQQADAKPSSSSLMYPDKRLPRTLASGSFMRCDCLRPQHPAVLAPGPFCSQGGGRSPCTGHCGLRGAGFTETRRVALAFAAATATRPPVTALLRIPRYPRYPTARTRWSWARQGS